MGRTLADVPPAAVTALDFRSANRMGGDAVVAVEASHEDFPRRLAARWSVPTNAVLEVEHVATEQASAGDFVAALPDPTVLAHVHVDRLGGASALVEVDLALALVLVERILGGPGAARPSALRAPTELETALLRRELLEPAVVALDEALAGLAGEPSRIVGVQTTRASTPTLAPTEPLVLLRHRVQITGDLPIEGQVTIAHPAGPLLSHLGTDAAATDVDPAPGVTEVATLLGAALEVRVQVGDAALHAGQLAGLAPGDVVPLSHRAGDPARLVVDQHLVGTAHLGRRGDRLAVQIARALGGGA